MNHCQFLSGYYPDCLCVSWGTDKKRQVFPTVMSERRGGYLSPGEREENFHQGKSKKSCLLLEKSQDKEKYNCWQVSGQENDKTMRARQQLFWDQRYI